MYTYTILQWILFFFIYCFLGWVWESCYVSVHEKKWVNRGFMHGPFLPIYGSGAIVVLLATIPVQQHLVLVFIFGMVAATVLEYFTGAMMEKIFHVRYWDYSDEPFNLHGHICLLCSVAWGFFSILMIKVLHQPIEKVVLLLPQIIIEPVTIVLVIGTTIDMTVSFIEAMDLKEMLHDLTENNEEWKRLQKRMDVVLAIIDSDKREWKTKRGENKLEMMSKNIQKSINVLETIGDKFDEKKKTDLKKLLKELLELKDKVHASKFIQNNRMYKNSQWIVKRNPGIVSKRYKEVLDKIKKADTH